jgi:threonine/homoserine/homoserine lactone efflux protein
MFFVAFLAGLIISFVASLPAGPVNLSIVHATLIHGRRSGLHIAFGALIVETLYAGLAVFGVHLIFSDEIFLKRVSLISIPVLIVLGLVSLFKKDFLKRYETRNGKNDFLTGVSLTLSNPMLLLFWITVSAFLQANEWMKRDLLNNLAFIGGVSGGVFLLFYFLVLITSRQNKKVTPRFKRNMNVMLGWLFLGLAIIMTLKALWEFFSGKL